MYSVLVFDPSPDVQAWRNVDIIYEDEFGYCHAFTECGCKFESLIAAFAEADGLWFQSGGRHRTSIVDLDTGERLYDSAAPVDIRLHPAFQVCAEPEWADQFCSAMSRKNPGATPSEVLAQARQMFPENRHVDPWYVAQDLLEGKPVPAQWPARHPRPFSDVSPPDLHLGE